MDITIHGSVELLPCTHNPYDCFCREQTFNLDIHATAYEVAGGIDIEVKSVDGLPEDLEFQDLHPHVQEDFLKRAEEAARIKLDAQEEMLATVQRVVASLRRTSDADVPDAHVFVGMARDRIAALEFAIDQNADRLERALKAVEL